MTILPDTLSEHPACWLPARLLQHCQMQTGRRGGPGGQHRNKVETAVILLEPDSGVSAEANERRSQAENRRVALGRLRLSLALEVRSVNTAQAPSPLWQQRFAGGRGKVAAEHQDYPALICELLDQLEYSEFDLAKTAAFFTTSSTQITKLLRANPLALQSINRRRQQLELHPLR